MIALLLIFPAFASCFIHIDITPATETSDPTVRYTGTSTWPITEADQRVFHVTDQLSRDSNDPNGVRVTVTPTNAVILDHKEESIVVAGKEFRNKIPMATVFKADFKEVVNEIVSSTWTDCPSLVAGKISMTFGNGKLSVLSSWGEQIYQSQPKTLSSDSGVEMTLQPGQGVQAVLKATKATMQVKIDYEATLHGNVCMRYKWLILIPDVECYTVQNYLRRNDLPTVLRASEVISIDYYYGAKVEVMEKEYSFILA